MYSQFICGDFQKLVWLIKSNATTMSELLANTADVMKIVSSREAMELIVSSNVLKPGIKENENYTDEVKKLFLGSTVISETKKYTAGLPFYLFKNGETGFSWTINTNAKGTLWCTNGVSRCRDAVISMTNTLYIGGMTNHLII